MPYGRDFPEPGYDSRFYGRPYDPYYGGYGGYGGPYPSYFDRGYGGGGDYGHGGPGPRHYRGSSMQGGGSRQDYYPSYKEYSSKEYNSGRDYS
ncbi:hypothetical protein HDU96_004657 [Phlyctochytrium bullatum]|nr:hypothetical protein HDU96_004657 [Phlyctochytrium bullatum]